METKDLFWQQYFIIIEESLASWYKPYLSYCKVKKKLASFSSGFV